MSYVDETTKTKVDVELTPLGGQKFFNDGPKFPPWEKLSISEKNKYINSITGIPVDVKLDESKLRPMDNLAKNLTPNTSSPLVITTNLTTPKVFEPDTQIKERITHKNKKLSRSSKWPILVGIGLFLAYSLSMIRNF